MNSTEDTQDTHETRSPTAPASAHTGGFEYRPYNADHVKTRRPFFVFPSNIPKHWLAGNAVRTHMMNTLNLFLPSYERMMARFTREKVLPLLSDPHLREQARGFLGQEAKHGLTHEKFCENLREQGYQIDTYLKWCKWIFEDLFEKKIGTKLNLAHIAGFEHYTAILVRLVLTGEFFDGCDEHMKAFYQWHAAEEVEHNAITYEMLRAIDDSYLLRQAGNVMGLSVILGTLLAASVMLLQQDGKLFERQTVKDFYEVLGPKFGVLQEIVSLFRQYMRRDHHPSFADHSAAAKAILDMPSA